VVWQIDFDFFFPPAFIVLAGAQDRALQECNLSGARPKNELESSPVSG
jgi:hypothetical protein